MSSIDLDASDLTILNRLNEKGRATYSELAEELGLTVPTVKSRIEKMLKIGIISRFGIYLNPHALTTDPSAMLLFQVLKEKKTEFLDHLKTLEEIKTVYEALDEYNVVVITQFQPLSMHQLLFEQLRSHSSVNQGYIKILITEVFSNPHRIPMHTPRLNIKCEYCGSQVSENYESIKIGDTRHYFCCPICLKNYTKWHRDVISR
jgi:Lrp/AsnC family transcriptional regulator for asnA, asnC and gidA